MQCFLPSPVAPPEPTFEEFYGRYHNYVLTCIRNCYWGSDPADDFEDLVQDVFVAAWRNYTKLNHEYVRAWLRQAARYASLSRRTNNGRRKRTTSLDAPLYNTGDDDILQTLLDRLGVHTNYDQNLEADELAENFRPDDLRLLAMLVEGFGMADIAKSLNTSVAAAQVRVTRARNRAIGAIPAT